MSLEGRFNELKSLDNGWSTFVCFAQAIAEKEYTRPTIVKFFDLLVDKSDYRLAERQQILGYLFDVYDSTG